MPLDLSALTAEITSVEDTATGAGQALHALFNEVEANKTDPAAIQALVDRGRAATDALAQAIADTSGGGAPAARAAK